MKKIILAFLFASISLFGLKAQSKYLEKNIKELTSPKYNGRGYTFNGMQKASLYLSKEFKKIGLKSISDGYLQQVSFPINIIHKTELVLNNQPLKYGVDYIVKPSSKSTKYKNRLENYFFDTDDYISSFQSKVKTTQFIANDEVSQQGKNIIMPSLVTQVDSIKNYYKQWSNSYENHPNDGRAIFRFVNDSLVASLSQRQANVTEFIVKDKYYSKDLSIDDFSVEAEFVTDFEFNNVIGYVDGENNDSVIVISAHYDHLGRVNDVIFPGASDNASGTAMVIDLARYFVKNKPKYKMYFMLFGAEEAGIVGAYKFVDNPLFPLNKIKFLLNLDIMGAGEDGIQVVNGTIFKKEFDALVGINSDDKYLKEIKIRGESCNSDHCPFYKKGVPSFFVYTLGGKGNYHNLYDTYKNLDLKYTDSIKQLLIKFIQYL